MASRLTEKIVEDHRQSLAQERKELKKWQSKVRSLEKRLAKEEDPSKLAQLKDDLEEAKIMVKEIEEWIAKSEPILQKLERDFEEQKENDRNRQKTESDYDKAQKELQGLKNELLSKKAEHDKAEKELENFNRPTIEKWKQMMDDVGIHKANEWMNKQRPKMKKLQQNVDRISEEIANLQRDIKLHQDDVDFIASQIANSRSLPNQSVAKQLESRLFGLPDDTK